MNENQQIIKLAILSPNKEAYSETFIQAQRNIAGTEVFFYYNGAVPRMLEGKGELSQLRKKNLLSYFWKKDFDLISRSFLYSLKKEQIQCVLAQYGTTGAAVFKLCDKLNVPLIVHFHGYDSAAFKLIERIRSEYKQMFASASYIVSVSSVMTEKLIKLGCPEEKIIQNPCAPNDTFFEIVPEYKEQLLLCVGRFIDKKAPYYTILAFSKVADQFPEARLVMIGDGPLLNTCRNIVKFLKIEDRVLFTGALSPIQVKDYFQRARAFVQHSVMAENGDMEGTPVAVLEAGAAAVPVLATRHAGIPDVVLDGKTGFLIDEHDVSGMAEKMKILLSDEKTAAQLGFSARAHVFNNFSMKIHLQKLRDTIERAVTKSTNS
jgi:colanic acid/amylovoran biosynthesis glycosyltransferase